MSTAEPSALRRHVGIAAQPTSACNPRRDRAHAAALLKALVLCPLAWLTLLAGRFKPTASRNTPPQRALLALTALLALSTGQAMAQVGDPTVTQVVGGTSHTCALTSTGAVKCWGANEYGQLGSTTNSGTNAPNNIPLDAQNLDSGGVTIAAGGYHTCALTSAGAVKCWGSNRYGQLGSVTNSGTSNPNNVPRDVQPLGSGVVAIVAGGNHTCALTRNGAVKCWGLNNYGQLGSTTNSGISTPNSTPLDVRTLGSGVVEIAAGEHHTCALTRKGAVKCWGHNSYGQLGIPPNSGNGAPNDAPLDVRTLGNGVVAIAAGRSHTCALTSAGAVKCWGWNRYGQLGSTTNSGSFDPNPVPLDVQTLGSDVASIAAGSDHTCALTSVGAVKCWGLNQSGQLGSTTNYGTLTPNPNPLNVNGLNFGLATIAAGAYHNCASTRAGAVKCWGRNDIGQLGVPNTFSWSIPRDVQTLSNIQRVGQSITFAPPASLLRGASLSLSAIASSGEPVSFDTWTPEVCTIIGNTLTATAGSLCGLRASQPGTANYAVAPQQLRLIQVSDPPVTQVAGSRDHTCALTSAGAIKCWGRNDFGQLGNPMNAGNLDPNTTPLDVQPLHRDGVAIATGLNHTCALTRAGAVKCWGLNEYGQLGIPTNLGTDTPHPTPLDVQNLGGGVAIAAGDSHTCALTRAGAVKCWGSNDYGQLGNTTNSGTDTPNDSPLDVRTLGSGVVAIAAGPLHTCALTHAGAVKCWGRNDYGQLGNTTNSGTTTPNSAPLDVQTLGNDVIAIATGHHHTCALARTGVVKCWGRNDYGQLGNTTNSGNSIPNNAPLEVQNLMPGSTAIAAGRDHTCALAHTGEVQCWGSNLYGQLGSTSNSGYSPPNNAPLYVQALRNDGAAIAAGDQYTCALTRNGAVQCWGFNSYRQLGNPTDSYTDSPLDVQTLSNIQPAGQAIAFFALPATLLRGTSLSLFGTAIASSGEPVSFDTWTPETCTIVGNVLTATANELCGVRASQPGSANYAAAPQQLRLIRIVRSDVLTLNVVGQGSVDVSPDPAAGGIDACTEADSPCTASYAEADAMDLDVAAAPAIGWHIAGWSGDCTADVADPLLANLTLDADKTCAATFAINSYTLAYSADTNGTISGSTPQNVNHGANGTPVSAVANAGYHFVEWSDGSTANPRTDSAVTANISVTASFAIDTYTLTYSAGANGTISGSSPQTVNHGASGTPVSAVANAGYHFVQWSDGSTANPRTDSAVTTDLSVTASFAINTYTVTANAGAHGSITPSTQTVDHGATASINVTAASGYHVGSVSGDTCSVSHVSVDIWSTDAISTDCAISATFVADPPELVLTIDDARGYARYGQLLTYIVTLRNQGTGAANAVSIAMSLPPQLDAQNTTWTCFGAGGGATCSATGTGALMDANVTIPAGRSLTWLVTTPVRADAEGATVDVSVTASDGINTIIASDSNILVILRSGFDVLYSDGTQGEGVFNDRALCATEQARTLDGTYLDVFALPPVQNAFDTLLIARAANGAGFRIERSTIDTTQLRLVTVAANGSESASIWTPVEPHALLALTTNALSDGQRSVLLEGAVSPISLPLPEGASNLWHLRMQRTESDCH